MSVYLEKVRKKNFYLQFIHIQTLLLSLHIYFLFSIRFSKDHLYFTLSIERCHLNCNYHIFISFCYHCFFCWVLGKMRIDYNGERDTRYQQLVKTEILIFHIIKKKMASQLQLSHFHHILKLDIIFLLLILFLGAKGKVIIDCNMQRDIRYHQHSQKWYPHIPLY